jgi:hypothetical protein
MNKILAKSLLPFTKEQVAEILTGQFTLVFDDGELATSAKQTLFSFYAWQFHQQYPNTPMLLEHHLDTVTKGESFSSNAQLKLLGNVMWSTHKAYVTFENQQELRDVLTHMVYRIDNQMYNDFSHKAEADVKNIDILDLIEVATHPEYLAVQNESVADKASVDAEHKILTKILTSGEYFPSNSLVKMTQTGTVRLEQVLQCVGPRGSLTDIDSVYFRKPIMRGFVRGIRSFYDIMIESRSSAKAQSFSEAPLEEAEYFARRLQLLCQSVETVHAGDCGSQHYLPWKVKPEIIEGGKVVYQGDLVTLEGKYYLDEKSNQLKVINKGDKSLEDKTVKIRSVVAGCQHPDPHGLCSTCFGDLFLSVPINTNIGHMCAASMNEQTTQSVLSTKHSDVNSESQSLFIADEYKPYVDIGKNKLSYVLSPALKNKHVVLTFLQDEATSLTDISVVDSVRDLSMTRVSQISMVGVTVKGKSVMEDDSVSVPVMVKKRKASLTYPMLEYIKLKGYEVNDNKCILVDMVDWNFDEPIMMMPMKHTNMSEHSVDIAALIESKVTEFEARDSNESPTAMLVDFYDLVNDKLKVNLAVLEIIMYASMCVDTSNNNFELPKPSTRKGLGVAKYTIAGRSLSAAMGYEHHRDTILNPASFFSKNRPSHPCDVFLMPQEAVADS